MLWADGFSPGLNMKKMRYFIAALAFGFDLSAAHVHAQTTGQTLTFSIICQYVTNVVTTNAAAGITNDERILATVLVDTANIKRAIGIDLAGTNWVKEWYPASIVREVNLTNGNEGIFYRHGTNQINISERFFGLSFTNEFTYQVPSFFGATNYDTTLPVKGGWIYMHPTNTITNFTQCDGLYFMSFNSSNLQFNLFGDGQGTEAEAGGHVDGKLYELPTVSTEITGAGTFNLNLTTNIYLTPTTNGTPAFLSGLAHGTIVISAPYYLAIPGP
jgi:hypothetical protein